ncbi:hypothetical protein [Methylobacter sp.]|uniref:hypothetical protein n=1 Tax=Methylobacter sp. TaxID=2051955 RepID=UPI0011FA19E6|nr:hypothetical protein [Methylobacter sp.]TAK60671.1 MAG: hypothetical protein EPO18_16470 [Methylobacter sp.]
MWTLIVIHKCLGDTTVRHPGRDCRDPDAMDGNAKASNKPYNVELKSSIHIPVLWFPAQIRLERICIYPKGPGQDSPE